MVAQLKQFDRKDVPNAIVIAGAVARGAYEAGVLAELLPRALPDLSNTVLLGTSAGAINAVLWAQYAHLGLARAGEKVKQVWEEIEDPEVFAALLPTLFRDLAGVTKGLVTGNGLASGLNASALRKTVKDRLDPGQIAQNLENGIVRGVGVIATACGEAIAGARSHAFIQSHTPIPIPSTASDSSIDYYAEKLEVDHVLASSAVPGLFQPIRIPVPPGSKRPPQFYVDGGVRLNTPIKPALDLGAHRLIVVSSHATFYPQNLASPEQIGITDSVAMCLHSILADRLVEDLNRLRDLNAVIEQKGNIHNRRQRPYRQVEFTVVSPAPGRLAREARDALGRRFWSGHLARYQALRKGLSAFGGGPGRDELLSYFFFDKDYAKAQMRLGEEDAKARMGWET